MANFTHRIGSDGTKKLMVDVGSAPAGTTPTDGSAYADAVALIGADGTSSIGTIDIDDIAPYPVAPIITVNSPTGAAYIKYTPDATALEAIIRARVTSEDLIYATLITHKIADATSIGAADATDLASSKTLVNEIVAEAPTHIASTAYHIAAGTILYPGHKAADTTNTTSAADMIDLASGYTLYDELAADVAAHAASTTFHLAASTFTPAATPNSEPTLRAALNDLRTFLLAHFASTAAHYVGDVENLRLLTATTPGSDEASDQTLINLVKTYWNSHCGIGAASAADLAAVICHANAFRAGLLVHYAATATHGGTADAANLATLTAVPACSDLATAQTLVNAEKATLNSHYAKTDNGAYVTVPAGVPLEWACLGSVFVKTSVASGIWTATEFRSA